MSPLVIAFHAAFLLNNLLPVWTWVALTLVVGTGVFGRFLFGFVPAQAGKVLELSEIRQQLKSLEQQIRPHIDEATNSEVVRRLFDAADAPPEKNAFLGQLLNEPVESSRLRRKLRAVRPMFPAGDSFEKFSALLSSISRAQMQIAFYGSLKRLFRGWLVVHVVVAIFMVVLIAAHVSVSLWLGYRWLFSVDA
jgi:hypothetical protein